ncbi:MAG: rhomboid family intramembrane serine protease, partial [Candidatus Micrarchaeota archaeon]|nr:rhomboid family intramembrane serine protease [Candidatus Micrarchaeota archaeon]
AGIAPPVPALGASGAIYAILGALAIVAPDMVVFLMFIPLRMRQAAVLWVIIEFFGTFNTMSGIASAAHLGGLVLGLAYAYFALRRPYEQIEFYK